MEYSYEIDKDDLVILSSPQHEVIWKGSFDCGRVVKLVALPGSDGCVVVVWNSSEDRWQNLIRVGPDGRVIWRAPRPPGVGGYSWVGLESGKLYAQSLYGYRLRLDIDTGAISEQEFTK
jgi:hypothetical protein